MKRGRLFHNETVNSVDNVDKTVENDPCPPPIDKKSLRDNVFHPRIRHAPSTELPASCG